MRPPSQRSPSWVTPVMMTMPTRGWPLRASVHLAHTGCSPSRAMSAGDRFSNLRILPSSWPSRSVISTIDLAWWVASSMVFHLPTGLSWAARTDPLASMAAATSSRQAKGFMGLLREATCLAACPATTAGSSCTACEAGQPAPLPLYRQRHRSWGSVPPTGQVGPLGRVLLDQLEDLRQVHGVVAQAGHRVWIGMVAVPAMLGTVAVVHLALVGRLGVLQEILHQVNGIVQIVVVHVADIDVDLALQARRQLLPVALQDVAQVVVVLPIL